MSETPEENKKEFLDLLIKRQEQQLSFFTSLESIRWKFTSAFGIGALGSLFISYLKDFDSQFKIVILILVIILSLSGIVTQVRIYALVVTIWRRILKIQKSENEILKELYNPNLELQQAMYYPRVGIYKKRILYYLTVGMTSCIVFSVIIGIASFAIMINTCLCEWFVIGLSTFITILFIFLSYKGSDYYMSAIDIPLDDKF